MPQPTLSQTARRWAFNRSDFILAAFVLALLIIGFVIFLGTVGAAAFSSPAGAPSAQSASGDSPKAVVVAVCAGWVTVFLACVGAAVRITVSRQGMIRLFSSEIMTIQHGIAAMKMYDFWEEVYQSPSRGARGFADVPRKENYFELFGAVGDSIGDMHPNSVDAVVRFYTYLRMSRDAASALDSWKTEKNSAVRREHISYVVQLLSLSIMWGFVARNHLGFEANAVDRELFQRLTNTCDVLRMPLLVENAFHSAPHQRAYIEFFRDRIEDEVSCKKNRP